jgi:type III secretion protein J
VRGSILHARLGRAARIAISVVALAVLSACGQQLYGSLDERGANEVVGALRAEGIRASKDKGLDSQWQVSVPGDEFSRAVTVLQRRNLPRRDFDGLGRVFRKDSLVSTPTEERARLIFAMSQELERTLTEIDGVISARVHPVIPASDPFLVKPKVSSASVLVKHRPGWDLVEREAMIRGLVASGVEGLAYDSVRVVLVAAEPAAQAAEAPALSRSIPPVFWGVLAVLFGIVLMAYFVLSWRDRSVAALDALRGRLIRKQRASTLTTGQARGKA